MGNYEECHPTFQSKFPSLNLPVNALHTLSTEGGHIYIVQRAKTQRFSSVAGLSLSLLLRCSAVRLQSE